MAKSVKLHRTGGLESHGDMENGWMIHGWVVGGMLRL